MAAPPRPLASIGDVADYLCLPVSTLYQWRSRRLGPPAARVGRHIRYSWPAVEKWAAEQFAADRSAAG